MNGRKTAVKQRLFHACNTVMKNGLRRAAPDPRQRTVSPVRCSWCDSVRIRMNVIGRVDSQGKSIRESIEQQTVEPIQQHN